MVIVSLLGFALVITCCFGREECSVFRLLRNCIPLRMCSIIVSGLGSCHMPYDVLCALANPPRSASR